jgi:hypothetical protein
MPIHTRLRDLYAFPGFNPTAHIHGVFGDPYAVVIPLRRVFKKQPAVSAAPFTGTSTIRPLDSFATLMRAAGVYTSGCRSVASSVVRVMP